ncbi:hypothetical protein [Novacetimonas maltaceti]|uniref:hypothetical protein n=1 Tax=Novacetimonas maltaceti TaxID=1203393 RepID=UPI0011B75349|nr:hypothetical protein [Novacetimonas maltaceti]
MGVWLYCIDNKDISGIVNLLLVSVRSGPGTGASGPARLHCVASCGAATGSGMLVVAAKMGSFQNMYYFQQYNSFWMNKNPPCCATYQ